MTTAAESWRACCWRRSVFHCIHDSGMANPILQRLMGASLLVFKNKSDVPGSMTEGEVRQVSGLKDFRFLTRAFRPMTFPTGASTGLDKDAQMDHHGLQCHDRHEPPGRAPMGCTGCKGSSVSLLIQLSHYCKEGRCQAFLPSLKKG